MMFYLISLAKYSNGYFFSKDTINDPIYQNQENNRKRMENLAMVWIKMEKRFKLVQITKVKLVNTTQKRFILNLKKKKKKLLL